MADKEKPAAPKAEAPKVEAAVVKPQETGVTVTDTSSILDVMKISGGFIPRLQFMTANSKKCKSGEFPINHYAIVDNDTFSDQGPSVDVMAYAARLMAIDFSDEEKIMAIYDPKLIDGVPSGVFKDIMDRSEDSDSNCMWGTQFLIYAPGSGNLATVFFGSKTSRRDAPAMLAKLGKAATLSAKKITTKRYEYYSMLVSSCSTPLDGPEQAKLEKALQGFSNPPEQNVEKVEEKADAPKQAR